jgi:hypothetical protein
MRPIFIIFLVLLAVIIIEAQTIPNNRAEFAAQFQQLKPDKSPNELKRQETLKRYAEKWVRNFNQKGRGVVVARFDGFLPIPQDLQRNLSAAFPKHLFTIARISILHHVWVEEPYIFLTDRQTGRVMTFSPDPLNTPFQGLASFADFLTFYPAKNDEDALFKVKTLSEFFLFPIKGRIGQINRSHSEVSLLLCRGEFSIRDYGLILKVGIKAQTRFGRLYFESDQWIRNKCSP